MTVPFKMDVDAEHGTEVFLDGEKVSGIYDVLVRHQAGQPSKLILHLHPVEGEVVGEAEVRFEIGGRVFVEAGSAAAAGPPNPTVQVRG